VPDVLISLVVKEPDGGDPKADVVAIAERYLCGGINKADVATVMKQESRPFYDSHHQS
jgi:hypothetical protein